MAGKKTSAGGQLKPMKSTSLNLSRRILENTLINGQERASLLQENNVQLARKVSELMKELTERTNEIQAARSENFLLNLKLNRLESVIVSVGSLRDSLANISKEIYNTFELVDSLYKELTMTDVSAAPSDTQSMHSLMAVESTNHFDVLVDDVKEVENEEEEAASYTAGRQSAESIEMEVDSSARVSDSPGGASHDVEEVIAVAPRRTKSRRITLSPAQARSLSAGLTPKSPPLFAVPKTPEAPPPCTPQKSKKSVARKPKVSPTVRGDEESDSDDDEDYVPSQRFKKAEKKAGKCSRAAAVKGEKKKEARDLGGRRGDGRSTEGPGRAAEQISWQGPPKSTTSSETSQDGRGRLQ